MKTYIHRFINQLNEETNLAQRWCAVSPTLQKIFWRQKVHRFNLDDILAGYNSLWYIPTHSEFRIYKEISLICPLLVVIVGRGIC